MKKALAILCVIVLTLSLFTLAGCGSSKPGEIPADSPYIGTWEAVRAEALGEEADMNEVLEGKTWVLTLKADGTMEQSTGDELSTGVWSITSSGLNVKLDDAKKAMKFTMEGDELVTKVIATIYFAKQS